MSAAVVVVILMIIATGWWPESSTSSYAAPTAHGDFHVLGNSGSVQAEQIERGERIASGGGGAELELGSYCLVRLGAHTDVTVRGEPFQEVVELHQGGLQVRITPERGSFSIRTPLGQVEVHGTEFETIVEYPNGMPGDSSMNGAKRVVVTVAVLSGAVLCELGDGNVMLGAGDRQVFADEVAAQRTAGEVTAATESTVTLKTKEESVTFHVPRENKLTQHEAGQLLKGDKVTVVWAESEGQRVIRDIDGEGVVAGTVTGLGDAWIEIATSADRKLKLNAPWRGGNPSDGGGPDRDVVKKLAAVHVGDSVDVTWAMPEGKRVMDVKRRQTGDLTKAPPELYGLSGRVIGRLVGRDVEKGELTLKIVKVDRVWRGNKAKNPHSAEGRTLNIDGVRGSFLDTLLTLKAGDGVQIEVKHVRGDGLTFLGEELKKVDIEDVLRPERETPRTESDDQASEAPAGLNGFRGILIGELLSKDVEKGTLVFKMEKVQRVWKANKAPAPEKSVGKSLAVEGISGSFLDTLLVLKAGDRIEVEAFHVRGQTLKFPGEWLKKAE